MKNIYAIFEYSPDTGLFAFLQTIEPSSAVIVSICSSNDAVISTRNEPDAKARSSGDAVIPTRCEPDKDIARCYEKMAECAKSYVIDRIGKLNFVDTINEAKPLSSYKQGSFVIRKNNFAASIDPTAINFEICVYKIGVDAGWTSSITRPDALVCFRAHNIQLPCNLVCENERAEEIKTLKCALNDANECYELIREKLDKAENNASTLHEEVRSQAIYADSLRQNAEMLEDCIVEKNNIILQLQQKIESRNFQIETLEAEIALRKFSQQDSTYFPLHTTTKPAMTPSYDKVVDEIKQFNRSSLKRTKSANDICRKPLPATAAISSQPSTKQSALPIIAAAKNHQYYTAMRWQNIARNASLIPANTDVGSTTSADSPWEWLYEMAQASSDVTKNNESRYNPWHEDENEDENESSNNFADETIEDIINDGSRMIGFNDNFLSSYLHE